MAMIHALRLTTTLLLLAALSCSSSRNSEPEGARQRGPTFVTYEGRSLDASISTRHTLRHLGDRWLVLEARLISRSGTLEIRRQDISVRDPAGHRLPMISIQEFRASYPEFRSAFTEPQLSGRNFWEEPVPLPECGWFFIHPSRGLSRDVIYIHPQSDCYGPLVFQVPSGVQPGRWVVMVDLEEENIRIPFLLEE